MRKSMINRIVYGRVITGRMIRRGDDRGGIESGSGNSGGENSGGGGDTNSSGNNSGQDFDPTSFWADPAEESSGGGNPQGPTPPANQGGGNEPPTLAGAIESRVGAFAAPPVMTPEVMTAIGEGDYSKFEQANNKAIQASMAQSMEMTVQLMAKFGEHLEQKFNQLVNSSHQQRDTKGFLQSAIPAAKNPKVAPIIEGLFERAMSVTRGDQSKAVEMTKRMMKAMAEETAEDLGLRTAPIGSDSDPAPQPKTNWLENLNSSG